MTHKIAHKENSQQIIYKKAHKKAQTKCGAHLQKELTESIATSTISKISDLTLEEGPFLPLEEVEEEWRQKRPEMLAQLPAWTAWKAGR